MAPGAAASTAAWIVVAVAGQRAVRTPTTVAPAGAGAGVAALAGPVVVNAQTTAVAPASIVVLTRPTRIVAPRATRRDPAGSRRGVCS
ncbi:hypothetical protein [Actinomycetospora chiangmaiensis]|uniref:hypothetical protein n=1 Tax=Actinomycetospora chiangmaiensis TaxID=402650 RepID=UPI00035DD346|nr:hypothetical protein [Actinomycetospora chiangmaiensis]